MKKKIKMPSSREALLLSLLLNKEKYGVELKHEYDQQTGKSISFGSLYVTLERMTKSGFIKPREGAATKGRGGIPRKYYRITGTGIRALNEYRPIAQAVLGLSNG